LGEEWTDATRALCHFVLLLCVFISVQTATIVLICVILVVFVVYLTGKTMITGRRVKVTNTIVYILLAYEPI